MDQPFIRAKSTNLSAMRQHPDIVDFQQRLAEITGTGEAEKIAAQWNAPSVRDARLDGAYRSEHLMKHIGHLSPLFDSFQCPYWYFELVTLARQLVISVEHFDLLCPQSFDVKGGAADEMFQLFHRLGVINSSNI